MIKYGLGNQLFAYAYARYCAEATGEKVEAFFPGKMQHGLSFQYGIGQSKLKLEKVGAIRFSLDAKGKNIAHKFIMFRQVIKTGLKKVNYNIEMTRNEELNSLGLYINYNIDNDCDYFKNIKPNMYIQGYFQFPRYPYAIRDILLAELTLSKSKCEKYEKIINDMDNSNSVALHIRRGDYFTNNRMIVYGEDYFVKAIDYMEKHVDNPTFYVFSEDAEYVGQISSLFSKSRMFYISESVTGESKAYDELCLMGCCKHFVISNSSYSWWGQFLGTAENKIVVAPSKWYAQDDMKGQLYEKDWVIMDD